MTRLRFERVFAACAAHDTELFTYSASTSVRAALLGAGFLVGRGVPTGTKPETTLAMTPLGRAPGRHTRPRAPRCGLARTVETKRCQRARRRVGRPPGRVRRAETEARAVSEHRRAGL